MEVAGVARCGSSKRSKVGDQKPRRYESESSTSEETALQLSRGLIKECAVALAILERRETEAEKASNLAHHEEQLDGLVCQCLDRRGETIEDALELSDDEEEPHRLMSDHQIEGPEEVPMEVESCTDGDAALSSMLKEAKAALKKLTANNTALGLPLSCLRESPPVAGKRRRGKEGDVDDEEREDDLEPGYTFSSPRHKKTREVQYAEPVEDAPDSFEVPVHSDSDREPSPVPVDPFDEVWKQLAVIKCQHESKWDGEQQQEGCAHIFETKFDVGKVCSRCGLIKDFDIKDLAYFVWRKSCNKSIQQRQLHARAVGEGGDGMVEEETGLMVGMLPPLELHKSLEDAMHPHQLEGFKFLSRNLVEQPDLGGCMLAFAPGTGKSLLIISFVHSFMCQVPNPRPMIVAPKSMIRPWMQEFKKWQVEETIVLSLYDGPDDAAKLQILKQWQETRNSVLLVSYSQFTNMTGEIETHLIEAPGLMVLDEGHLARTDTTKILKSLRKVHTKRRVLLSGTPFHNNFQEFYTTLELVRPNFMQKANPEMKRTLNALIGDINLSHETINHDITTNAFCQLRNLISPFVAWHKGQILNTLPGITDLTVLLELTSQQRELLQKEKSHDSLVRDTLQKRAAAVYFHPIMEPVSDATGKRSQHDPRLKGDDIDVKQGVKLRWVLDLIHLCEAAREKVLVFSEYLYALELIENVAVCRLNYSRGVQILRIDGTMEIGERERAITRFNNDPGAKMMCASIKACGEGISLVGASRVVILEVAWNPSVTRQAISRAFRIGQQKKVVVYRLIAADTHEEHRMHAASTRKEWLSKLLFDPSVSCIDPNSILRDVTNNCSDMFLDHGPLRNGVHSIYEREF